MRGSIGAFYYNGIDRLANHLGYFFASELKGISFVENAEQFPPAHFMQYDLFSHTHTMHKYYEISLKKLWPEPSLETIHYNINQILRKSIQ